MNGSFLPVDRLHKISLGLQHLSLALGFGRTERGFSTLLPVLETLGLLSKHSLELSLRLLLLALLLALILPAHAAVASQPTCGIILMHGKWGMPQSPYLKPVVEKLSPDCRVVLLEMPWSRKRLYDKPYRDALQQIKVAVDSLRQSGAQWIAVGGQSFGANAALAYMAQVGDMDAIISTVTQSRHYLRQEPYAAILPVRICAGGDG